MSYKFCTLFDSHYLSRGLALYKSLESIGCNFHLYIFAFDDNVYIDLKSRNLSNATIISLSDFETQELLLVKNERTRAEYCWTCTPSTISYCLTRFNLDHCTYIDADMYFYNNPKIVFDEISTNSVAITDHNYFNKYDQSETSGKFCVQFVYFKNDLFGREALEWWRKSCIHWCFSRLEDGKFGDQKYLDYFPKMFKNVLIINNKGAGVAPWNANRFELKINENDQIFVHDLYTNDKHALIFFHFHNLKISIKDRRINVFRSKFSLPKEYIDSIYTPYINNLISIENKEFMHLNHEIYFEELNWFYTTYYDIRLYIKKKKFFRIVYSNIFRSIK
jgi:hypothetical protein